MLCLVALGLSYGIASAGATVSYRADSFGLASQTVSSAPSHLTTLPPSQQMLNGQTLPQPSFVLTTTAVRDISSGISSIEAKQQEQRKAAQQAARQEEQQHIAVAQAAKAAQQAALAQEGAAYALFSLSDVDWTVGKDAFLSEWSARLDAYLSGSPLAGHGSTFALAAWNNGVDPRWSPAIANTESSKGLYCFAPFNAWGWGSISWSNWDDAINAQVAGLASRYGYSLTYANATTYCPPNSDHWFNATLSEMYRM